MCDNDLWQRVICFILRLLIMANIFTKLYKIWQWIIRNWFRHDLTHIQTGAYTHIHSTTRMWWQCQADSKRTRQKCNTDHDGKSNSVYQLILYIIWKIINRGHILLRYRLTLETRNVIEHNLFSFYKSIKDRQGSHVKYFDSKMFHHVR